MKAKTLRILHSLKTKTKYLGRDLEKLEKTLEEENKNENNNN